MADLLTRKALNRATLDRQLMLARTSTMSVIEVLERVVGMQAQAANPPYYGLWARIEKFHPDQLAELVTARKVVRIALMRSTIHSVTAEDCLMLRPLIQPVLDRGMQGVYGKSVEGLDTDELLAHGRELLETEPMMFAELGSELAKRWPGRDEQGMAAWIRTRAPLVQVPPRGLWGFSGQARHTTAESWLGRPLRADSTLDEMFLRYLAGFGPASVMDVQTWSGLTRLREVAERLRPRLKVFRSEDGAELFDLPDAPRPGEKTPAPVRYAAEFENMLLSYADRSRIISEEHRKLIFTPNGLIPGTILVDGFVAGTWKLTAKKKQALLQVSPFGKLTKKDTAALQKEGVKLLDFAAPGTEQEIQFSDRSAATGR